MSTTASFGHRSKVTPARRGFGTGPVASQSPEPAAEDQDVADPAAGESSTATPAPVEVVTPEVLGDLKAPESAPQPKPDQKRKTRAKSARSATKRLVVIESGTVRYSADDVVVANMDAAGAMGDPHDVLDLVSAVADAEPSEGKDAAIADLMAKVQQKVLG